MGPDFFEGCEARREDASDLTEASESRFHDRGSAASARPATETRRTPSGSGMQQARNLCAEEAVEVVQNHEGGTRPADWHPTAEGDGDIAGSERTDDPYCTQRESPSGSDAAKVGWRGAICVGRKRGNEAHTRSSEFHERQDRRAAGNGWPSPRFLAGRSEGEAKIERDPSMQSMD